MSEAAAWAIFFLPLASFVIIAFVIRPFFNRFEALSGYLTIAAIGAAFVLSVQALAAVWNEHGEVGWEPHSWIVIGDLEIALGILMDPLTAVLLVVITGVSLLVQDLLPGVHARGLRLLPLLQLHVPVHGLHAGAGAGPETSSSSTCSGSWSVFVRTCSSASGTTGHRRRRRPRRRS